MAGRVKKKVTLITGKAMGVPAITRDRAAPDWRESPCIDIAIRMKLPQ